jgi:PAS domain-containing protein
MQRAEFESWKPVDVARLLALVEAERRYYQLLLEELPVAVAVAGDKGELRAANRAFRLTFSLDAGDVGAHDSGSAVSRRARAGMGPAK